MNIIEVRDGFIKFEADDDVFLSSFLQINDSGKKYIAQVMQLRDIAGKHIASAKFLFLFDGALQPYDKTLPSVDSEIKEFTFNILNNSINAKNPIIAGLTPKKDISIIVDASAFDKKMIASIDDKKSNNIIVRNLSKQFNNVNKNVVIIDTLGVVEANKYVAGVDFKLPLDTDSLAFMYEDCLNDATSDSKSMIIDIFKDLSEYSKTVPFLPFETLKSIVDEMVDKSHVFKLLVLKNKLAKFDRLGYFAVNDNEVKKIDKILEAKCSVVDLSKLDSAFQNRYLAYLYEKLKNKENSQVILELSNTTSKKNLKKIMQCEQVPTTFITHSRFKYLNDIKNFFDNFIIEPSITNNQIFRVYNSFLSSMNKDEYLIAGESVNYIPLVSQMKIIEDVISAPKILEETSENITDSSETNPAELNDSIEKQQLPEQDEELNEIIALPAPQELQVEESDEPVELENENEKELPVAVEEENNENEETEDNVEPVEVIEPEMTVTKEEILENIDQKSDALISEISKEELTPPVTDMFSDSDDDQLSEDELEDGLEEKLDDESSEIEDENEESIIVEEQDEDSSEISDDEITEIDLEDEPVSEEIEQTSDIEQVSDNLEIAEQPDTLEELENESLLEEVLMDDSIVDSNHEEIIDFSPEEIQEDETVEQISMADQFDIDSVTFKDLNMEEELQEEPQEIEEYHTNTDVDEESENPEIEVPDEIDLDLDDSEAIEELPEESLEEENLTDIPAEENVLPLNDNADFEELVELDPSEADTDDIIVDIAEDEQPHEIVDEQIVKDVDKVFTTRKDDDISESDLDLIDELNSDGNEELLQEVSDSDDNLEELVSAEDDGILDEPQETIDLKAQDDNDEILETKNSSTPIVPVYDADIPQEDMVKSDPIQQGDTVIHAKYGSGVVEKMIKYGNKTLFSINFDNIGRRLLDPTLTEIKKA